MHCTACGKANHSGRFCTGCGTALPQHAVAAPAPAVATQAPAFGGTTVEMPAEPYPEIERSGTARASQPEAFLQLHPSETAVVHAASRIFAAYVAAGRLTDGNQAELEERSVRAAVRIAVLTDRLVQSDDEEW